MDKYFYKALLIFFGFSLSLNAGEEMEAGSPPSSLISQPDSLENRRERINIVGTLDSHNRVILQSWEKYKIHTPSLKLDRDLDILVLEYLIDLQSPNGFLSRNKINDKLLKNKDFRDVPSRIFSTDFGYKINYINEEEEYAKILKEKQELKEEQANLAPTLLEQWDSYGKNCMLRWEYVNKGGYTKTVSYIHYLPDFIIDYMLICFTVNYFETHKIKYSGERLKQTLNRWDSLFNHVEDKSSIFREGKHGYSPSGFGSFITGPTRSRYKMEQDKLDIEGNIVSLGNGICDFHKNFLIEEETSQIILNDLNPLFPLLVLHTARLSENVLNHYEVVGGSAVEMTYEDNSISKIYAGYLLKYLSPQEIEKMFHDISKALKIGGRFYIDKLCESTLQEMWSKAERRSATSSLNFVHHMKSQPSMDFLKSVAGKYKMQFIYGANEFTRDELPVRTSVKSNNLIFEKVSG